MTKQASTSKTPTKSPKSPTTTGKSAVTAPRKSTSAAPQKTSALSAAARILGETKEAMTCPELITAMASKGYWTSPAGKTPASTLYAALKREITIKKKEARFKQSGPGNFTLA
jgi:HB1, ASXL, restriction endonuclease HTH domain